MLEAKQRGWESGYKNGGAIRYKGGERRLHKKKVLHKEYQPYLGGNNQSVIDCYGESTIDLEKANIESTR